MRHSSRRFYKFPSDLPRLYLWIFVFVAALGPSTALAQDFLWQKGNVPVIVVSVHGGWQKLEGAPERQKAKSSDPRFSRKKDLVTYQLALSYREQLDHQLGYGRHPSWFSNRVHRKFVDLNRKELHATESSLGREYHRRFHRQLQSEIARLRQQFDWVVVLDIHGQAALPVDLIVGTQKGRATEAWAENLMWDDQGILSELRSAGFKTEPIGPKQAFRFAGGFITKKYGRDRSIQVFQLEHGKKLRFNKEANEKFTFLFCQRLVHRLENSQKFGSTWFTPDFPRR